MSVDVIHLWDWGIGKGGGLCGDLGGVGVVEAAAVVVVVVL